MENTILRWKRAGGTTAQVQERDFKSASGDINIVFIIDTSGSMKGRRIDTVNETMREVVGALRAAQSQISAQIKISVMTFSNGAMWIYPKPIEVSRFNWLDIGTAGNTNLGDAYEKLTVWLESEVSEDSSCVFILLTDGHPNPGWKRRLTNLKQKRSFDSALRYALAIEIDTPEAMDVLERFVGGKDAVLQITDVEAIRRVIKVIAVTASEVKAMSKTAGDTPEATSNDLAKKAIFKGLAGIPGIKR